MTRPKWLAPPDDLDDRAKTYWKDYASSLHAAGKLTFGGYQNFRTLCILWSLRDRCGSEISEHGPVIRASTGSVRANPAVTLLMRAEKRVAELMAEFGL